jgi:hypothetical protein
MIKKLTKLAAYLGKEDFVDEADNLSEIIRSSQLPGRAPFDDDVKVAAVYPGNMGMMEMFQFQRDADPSQKKTMDRLLRQNRTNEAWDFLKKVTGVDLIDPPEHPQGQGQPEPSDDEKIASAANKILKPGFDVLGHGTSIGNAKSIIEKGFGLRGHPLNHTFLSMSNEGSTTIGEQLEWWPYGESSDDGTLGVAIMRVPQGLVGVLYSSELTEMVSVPPKVAPRESIYPEGHFLHGVRSTLPENRNFDEERLIPSFFFFAIWDQTNKSLILNPNYDEAKILEHLSLDEAAIAPPEPVQPSPVVTIAPPDPDDLDNDVF